MTTATDTAITIRRATEDDLPALRRLAQLDRALRTAGSGLPATGLR